MNFTFKRIYRGPLQAVILDWAGTTVDYGSQAPAMIFIEVFKRSGVEISFTEAREPMGMAKIDHIRQIAQMPAVAERWQAVHRRLPTEEDVAAMYEEFVPLQLEILADYAELIPGARQAVDEMRRSGLKIGSNTGYNREMVNILLAEAEKQGYRPDSTVCASDVLAGRPAPWMSLLNAQELGVYPMEAVVKIDDTLPGIEEGLNAGMWTIGLTKTGNELGLDQAQIEAAPVEEIEAKLKRAYQRMVGAGAHYVVDGIWDVPAVLADINSRLAHGEKP